MKRILMMGNNDGGLYLFRGELIQELIQKGYEVHFTVPFGEKVHMLEEIGAIYHPIDVDRRGMNVKKDFRLLMGYIYLLKKINPQLIMTYTIKPNIYAGIVARYLKIPCIATITGLGSSLQGKGLKTKIIKLLYRFSLKTSKNIFFQNIGNREFFIKNNLLSEDKVKVVNGSGVNTEKFKPDWIEHEGVNLLFISRIMREKGVEEYLEAAERLKKTNPNVNFQILGFYDEEDLKDRIEKLNKEKKVTYLGVSNDTRNEMKQADCIVLPSYHEGMSNVLLEGASFALPLITTRVPGCIETVDEGKTGILCEARNVDSLIGAIEKFLSLSHDERMDMGRLGRERMISYFDRKLVTMEYIQAIENII